MYNVMSRLIIYVCMVACIKVAPSAGGEIRGPVAQSCRNEPVSLDMAR